MCNHCRLIIESLTKKVFDPMDWDKYKKSSKNIISHSSGNAKCICGVPIDYPFYISSTKYDMTIAVGSTCVDTIFISNKSLYNDLRYCDVCDKYYKSCTRLLHHKKGKKHEQNLAMILEIQEEEKRIQRLSKKYKQCEKCNEWNIYKYRKRNHCKKCLKILCVDCKIYDKNGIYPRCKICYFKKKNKTLPCKECGNIGIYKYNKCNKCYYKNTI